MITVSVPSAGSAASVGADSVIFLPSGYPHPPRHPQNPSAQRGKKAGISGWQVNTRVRLGVITRQVDFVFARARVAVEIDGWAWHHTPDRFQQDRAKQNALVHAGWRVLRFTWFDLTQRPNDVIAQLRQALSVAA